MNVRSAVRRIASFSGAYSFLSNFHPSTIHAWGLEFPTVEHAFQAAKTMDMEEREAVRDAGGPGDAKRHGRKRIQLRKDWEYVKIDVMRRFIIRKFEQPEFARLLDETDNAILIEGNNWGDHFWGVCRGNGHNHLGRLLMETREELRWIR